MTESSVRRGSDRAFTAQIAVLVLVLIFPWLPFVSFSVLGTANLAAYYAMVAISLVVITGWVGQISLGHAGLVGVGAYVTGHVVRGWHITFPINVIWAAIASAAVAVILGVVALRVRGLYLAVATLIFSWTAAEFLFRQEWFTRNSSFELRPFGEPGTFPFFDWTSRRTYFYAGWALVATAAFLAANLRDSKTGRAFFAVRGSEVAAASLGISVVRTKLTAFAVSGALAGVAGNMLIVRDQVVTPDAFKVEVSLFFLAIAVVGGLSSLGGAVAASIVFALLNELFFRLEFLTGWLEVVPPLLLTAVLLLYRGGLAAIPGSIATRFGPQLAGPLARLGRAGDEIGGRLRAVRRRRDDDERPGDEPLPPRLTRWLDRIEARLPERAAAQVARLRDRMHRPPTFAEGRLELAEFTAPARQSTNGHGDHPVDTTELAEFQPEASAAGHSSWRERGVEEVDLPADRADRRVVLDAAGITVRFGGLVAVNDVSLTIREHEIVGLIGPNGAGKTTTFNSIAGLNVPTAGTVTIYGYDVTQWTVDRRARLGVGRTFQAIQLLPQLSVFDNLLVATHLQNDSGITSHALVGTSSLLAEREARHRVRQVAALLELEEYLDRQVADLPFGVLRMVELARALVTGSKLIMLDEPASGLDTTETDRLAEIVQFIRSLGVTILLIEHDVKMVTSVSDYMYVLDHGTLIAEGTPAEIQRDPRVIAAYLGSGSDDEAEEPVLEEAGR